jgi:hypothetical protein
METTLFDESILTVLSIGYFDLSKHPAHPVHPVILRCIGWLHPGLIILSFQDSPRPPLFPDLGQRRMRRRLQTLALAAHDASRS